MTFTSSDHFCLDGDYLVEVGSDTPTTREFRPEHDPFTRVLVLRDTGGTTGPEEFVVYEKGGLIRHYGSAPDSRLEGFRTRSTADQLTTDAPSVDDFSEPARLAWFLSQVEDRSGNVMFYDYVSSLRCQIEGDRCHKLDVRLSAIRYTFGPEDPTTRRSVRFDYVKRRDTQNGFVAGYETRNEFLLKSIAMFGPNPKVEGLLRSYELIYNWDLWDGNPLHTPSAADVQWTITQRSLLQHFQECDPNGVCKRPTTFRYERGTWDFEDIDTGIGGDGADDLGWGDAIGNPEGNKHWGVVISDINGDGRDDILYRRRTAREDCSGNGDCLDTVEWFFRLSTGTAFEAIAHPAGLPPARELRSNSIPQPISVDLDADGKPELLVPIAGALFEGAQKPDPAPEWQVWTFDSTAAKFVKKAVASDPAETEGTPVSSTCKRRVCNLWPAPLYVQDLNGDGLPDLVRLWKEHHPSYLLASDLAWGYRLNSPSGLAPAYQPFNKPLEYTMGTPAPVTLDEEYAALLVQGTYASSLDASGRGSLLLRHISRMLSGDRAGAFNGSRYVGIAVGKSGVVEGRITTLPTSERRPGDLSSFHYQFVDINGDGLDDALKIPDFGSEAHVQFGVMPRVAVNTGNGHRAFGDALSDLGPKGAQIQPDGFLLNTAEMSSIDPGVRALDIDEDGRADLVAFGNNGAFDASQVGSIERDSVVWYRSTGTTFAAVGPLNGVRSDGSSATIPTKAHAGLPWADGRGYPMSLVLDVDGDGRGDMVHFAADHRLHLYRHAGRKPDHLTQIDNGIGHEINVEYAPKVEGANSEARCQWPLSCVVRGIWVVSRSQFATSNSTSRATTYEYSGGTTDRLGRGWLGFAKRVETDASTLATTSVTFARQAERIGTSYPFARSATEIETIVQAGGTVRTRRHTVGCPTSHPRLCTPIQIIGDPAKSQAFAVRDANWTDFERENGPAGLALIRRQQTLVEYDSFGNVIHQVVTTPELALQDSVTSWFESDPAHWLIAKPLRREAESTVGGTTRKRVETFTASPETGLLLGHTIEPGSDTDTFMHEQIVRNRSGQVIGTVRSDLNMLVRQSWIAWDSLDGVFPSELTDTVGNVTRLDYHAGLGLLVRSTDENGVTTRYSYDRLGRMLLQDEQAGDRLHLRYLDTGAEGFAVEQTADSGVQVTRYFDLLARERLSRARSFDGRQIERSTTYDQVFPFQVAVVKGPSFVGDATAPETSFTYDGFGRLQVQRLPDGTTTQYAYSGRQTTVTDPRGRKSVTSFDLLGRVIAIAEQGVVSLDGESPHDVTTLFGYTHFNQLSTTTDARGNVRTATYDALGRKLSVLDPDSGLTKFAYNAFSEVREETDATSHTTVYYRDEAGRVTASSSPVDGDTCLTWDAAPHGLGKLAEATTSDGIIDQYTYDAAGRLETHRAQYGFDLIGEMRWGYDASGRVSEVHYPAVSDESGLTKTVDVKREYSALDGSLRSVSVGNRPVWSVSARDVWGHSSREVFANGVVTKRTFDSGRGFLIGQHTAVEFGAHVPPGGETIDDLSYHYNSDGTLKSEANAVLGTTEVFDYDAAGRLSSWRFQHKNGAFRSERYDYDDLGNLLVVEGLRKGVKGVSKSSVTRFEIDGSFGPHAVTSIREGAGPSETYGYDLAGRQTLAPERPSVSFKSFGLASSVSKTDGSTEKLFYDWSRRRSVKDEPGKRILYLDDLYERHETDAGTEHIFSVSGDSGLVLQITVETGAGGLTEHRSFVHAGRGGTVASITDEKARVTRQRFDPWGGRIDPQSGEASAAVPEQIGVGFEELEHDQEVGLINMRGRHYDPRLRRFISPDPFLPMRRGQVSSAQNRFGFGFGNPVMFGDPSGFEPDQWHASPVFVDSSPPTSGEPEPPTFDSPGSGTPISLTKPDDVIVHHSNDGISLTPDQTGMANRLMDGAVVQDDAGVGGSGPPPDYYGPIGPNQVWKQFGEDLDAMSGVAKSYSNGEVSAYCSYCTDDPTDPVLGPWGSAAYRAYERAYDARVHEFMQDVFEQASTVMGGVELGAAVSAPRRLAAAIVHGNSRLSTKAQHLYMIVRYGNNGTAVEIYKFGISGGKLTAKAGGVLASRRAAIQVFAKNLESKLLRQGFTYEYKVMASGIPGRTWALELERATVSEYMFLFNDVPPGNALPTPVVPWR